MQRTFSIPLILILLLYSHQACCLKMPEKRADADTSIISREYLDMIEEADTIMWLLLDPMETDSTTLKINGIGEILLSKTDTLEERRNALKSMLTYPQSFTKANMVKECTFLPDIQVCFFSEKGVAIFSYSFYCDLCRFERDGKYQDTDGELIRKSIIQMACEIFPKDKYLRNLKRKEP